MKDKIESTILLTTIIFPISMFIINKILGIFDWHLRYWIWTLVFFVIHAGGYSFSIFAICTMRSKIGRFIVIPIWSFICLVICFINLVIFSWCVRINGVKEIDGINYIGVNRNIDWDYYEVSYYDKYNWFAYNDDNIIVEESFEDNDKFPRHRTYYNNDGTNHSIYFDKKGNIITREEFLKLDD